MIKGIGIDIVDRTRFDRLSDPERFLEQVFTDQELSACRGHHDTSCQAQGFAVKEGVMKAFGIGLRLGSHWQDIEMAPIDRITVKGAFTPLVTRTTTIRATCSRSKQYALGMVLVQE